ncbi:GTP-binding ADP-ribosylation factor [Aphelenchoides avenae]|nr:GTP-binding ADP-ribosylation factor [Aphelenchus avenae]
MLNLWDLGGHPDLQSLWSNYLDECHAVIYVIDLSDPTRIDEAIEAFEKPLAFERVRHLPILIALNKCDQCEETVHATNGTANGSAATVDRSHLHERLEELCAAAQHTGDMAVISISAISSHNVAKCVQWLLSALIQKAQAEPPARA